MTQEKLAAQIDLSKQHLGEIERGVATPSLDTLFRACEVLKITPANLFVCGGADEAGKGHRSHKEQHKGRVPEKPAVRMIATTGTWTIDLVHGKAAWSRSLCRLLGRSLVRAPSHKQFLKHLAQEDAVSFTAFYKELTAGEIPPPMTCTITRKDGESRILHIHGDLLPHGHASIWP